MKENDFLLEMNHISKEFPGVKALDDVTIKVRPGTVHALMGENGAGKSTLLKILTGVSSPTTGYVKSLGQIRSILELGVGFNPELTGAENVYYNGLVWGFSFPLDLCCIRWENLCTARHIAIHHRATSYEQLLNIQTVFLREVQ